MMYEVMNSINNHFVNTKEKSKFTIVADGIESESNFSNVYLPGQYILIKNSILNDGVYKVASFNSNKITVEEVLLPEVLQSIYIFGLRVPKDFVTLVSNMKSWQDKNNCNLGVSSEKIDDYQINYNDKTSEGYLKIFEKQLNTYRRLYSDVSVSTYKCGC